jgi:hypothetical protein
MPIEKIECKDLINDLVVLIQETKTQVISNINSSLTVSFWHVGNLVLNYILQNKRADYGKQIVVSVSRELVERFGRNYEEKNLRRMIQFIEKCRDFKKVIFVNLCVR